LKFICGGVIVHESLKVCVILKRTIGVLCVGLPQAEHTQNSTFVCQC
jgi:hypothetical protein